MTTAHGTPLDAATGDADAAAVAQLHRRWVLLWDRAPGGEDIDFATRFDGFYDFGAPDGTVILFDDFDPERRVLRSAKAYGEAFWPSFQRMQRAEHAIEEAPEVVLSGDLAASRLAFIARLVMADGEVVATRAINSQVWRRQGEGRWTIVRDQTAVETIPVDEADRAIATLPRY